MGDKTKKKLDSHRLSKQRYERDYLAKKARKFLRETHVIIVSDNLTKKSIKKLARYYLKNYKKV